MLVCVRCAPGQSYINPAERVMAILNYGLQNCSTERKAMDDETEATLRKCNSTSEIREMAKKKPGLQKKWEESVQDVQAALSNRFQRLNLKDEPIRTLSPVTEEDMGRLQQHLGVMFPSLDPEKLQKIHTEKCQEYVDWKAKHCRETHYTFQIKKCDDPSCCPKDINITSPSWLPEPVLDITGEHFLPYSEVKETITTEKDRPSLKQKKASKGKSATLKNQTDNFATPMEDYLASEADKTPFRSAQTARSTVTCIECHKPRVIYSPRALNQRQQMCLAVSLLVFISFVQLDLKQDK